MGVWGRQRRFARNEAQRNDRQTPGRGVGTRYSDFWRPGETGGRRLAGGGPACRQAGRRQASGLPGPARGRTDFGGALRAEVSARTCRLRGLGESFGGVLICSVEPAARNRRTSAFVKTTADRAPTLQPGMPTVRHCRFRSASRRPAQAGRLFHPLPERSGTGLNWRSQGRRSGD